jgi:hypothetical protein
MPQQSGHAAPPVRYPPPPRLFLLECLWPAPTLRAEFLMARLKLRRDDADQILNSGGDLVFAAY